MQIRPYIQLMRANQPVGFLLLMWPMLWAQWLASRGHPHLGVTLWLVLGCWLMRAGGCILNDLADRHIDPYVERTRHRPLATGAVSVPVAIALALILLGSAYAVVLQLNTLTIQLAWVGLGLACIYPLSKRFIKAPQLVLGLAFSWGIPMAFSAETGHLTLLCWWLFLVSCFWPIAYDVMYAMADCNDDKHLGIGSLALWLGHYAPIVVLLCHLFLVIGLVHIGHLSGANDWFFGGLMLASLCVYRQMFYLKAGSSRSYIKAFKNNQWYGGLIWLCFCIAWLKI